MGTQQYTTTVHHCPLTKRPQDVLTFGSGWAKNTMRASDADKYKQIITDPARTDLTTSTCDLI